VTTETFARPLHVHHVPRLVLESGAVLEDVRQGYHLDGRLNVARDNLVLVFHALTGSADAAGGWWRGLIGPGASLDTDRYAVLAPNLLGSCYGTTGPSTFGEPAAFPLVTPRDMARLVALLVDTLQVRRVALVTGGSLGGMVALEWALLNPGRTDATVVLAAPAAHTALGIGWGHLQREALRFGRDGLALARMIGMLSFRTETEFEQRFARERGAGGRFEVQRYLDHHGDALVARFDTDTYRVLLDAMDAHDLGAGRGGLPNALRLLGESAGHLVGAGIPGDLLYGDTIVREWVTASGGVYEAIDSVHGHDAFLLEREQVGRILSDALAVARPHAHTSTPESACLV